MDFLPASWKCLNIFCAFSKSMLHYVPKIISKSLGAKYEVAYLIRLYLPMLKHWLRGFYSEEGM